MAPRPSPARRGPGRGLFRSVIPPQRCFRDRYRPKDGYYEAPAGPGFGSIRVTATVGASTWDTSVFPDKASGSFVLPIKKDVRRANQIVPGDVVDVVLQPPQPR